MKPTVFVTVSRGIIARNLLLTDFIGLLEEQYHVVLVAAMHDDPAFRQMFGKYEIIPLYSIPMTRWQKKVDQCIISLGKALIYNPTVELRTRYGMGLRNEVKWKRTRFFIQKYILGTVFAHEPFRKALRWVDSKIFPCRAYDELFEKHKPVMIFATAISGPEDALLVRNAKKHGIKSMGMAKSWDNCSKFAFREKVDTLAVWGQYMMNEAMEFQGYGPEDIEIVGIPQFDFYPRIDVPSKEEFCESYGLDPEKKIIFIGSEGPINDHHHLVPLLKEKIEDGTLAGYQILARPHFSYRHDIARFEPFVDNKTVFLDREYNYSNTKDGIEISVDGVRRMLAQMKHSDVLVTGVSTLMLDMSANNRHVLLYDFDKDDSVSYKDSVRRFYTSLWFQEIAKMNLDNVAHSGDELVEMVQAAAQNPTMKQDERNMLIRHFCHKIDGRSSRRVFELLHKKAQQA